MVWLVSGSGPTTGSSGTTEQRDEQLVDATLQPHNGFIWNTNSSSSSGRMLGLQPHNGFIWNDGRAVDGPQGTATSTPQRVHLERQDGRRRYAGAGDSSTPQRVHLERSHNARSTRSGRCFNPTTGSSGTRGLAKAPHPPQDSRGFNPTTGSSGTSVSPGVPPDRFRLQPHNGFIWNRALQRRRAVVRVASTPQRVHLERLCRRQRRS